MVGGIDTDSSYSSYIPKLTKDQAIRIIQKNERGRQGNVRAKLMKELRDEDSMRKKLTASGTGQAHPTTAATLIQKVFRGHLIRMKIAKQTQEEFVFLGMKSLSLNTRKGAAPGTEAGANGTAQQAAAASKKYDPLTKEAQIRAQRKTRQIEHELKYIESLVELQKSVTEVEGPEMKDAMWEERSAFQHNFAPSVCFCASRIVPHLSLYSLFSGTNGGSKRKRRPASIRRTSTTSIASVERGRGWWIRRRRRYVTGHEEW